MGALNMGLLTIIFTFTFVELFDAMGTMVGMATKAGLMDKTGRFPGMGKAMLTDAAGVSIGSLLEPAPLPLLWKAPLALVLAVVPV